MIASVLLAAALLAQGGPTLSEDPEAAPDAAGAAAIQAAPKVHPAQPVSAAPQVTVTAKSPPPPSKVAVVRTAAADPVVCRTVDVTGSHFTQRQCLTASQWAQMSRDGQDLFNTWSAQGGTGFGAGK